MKLVLTEINQFPLTLFTMYAMESQNKEPYINELEH